jgi:hypothetical protein
MLYYSNDNINDSMIAEAFRFRVWERVLRTDRYNMDIDVPPSIEGSLSEGQRSSLGSSQDQFLEAMATDASETLDDFPWGV